jgi:hypothetical protein
VLSSRHRGCRPLASAARCAAVPECEMFPAGDRCMRGARSRDVVRPVCGGARGLPAGRARGRDRGHRHTSRADRQSHRGAAAWLGISAARGVEWPALRFPLVGPMAAASADRAHVGRRRGAGSVGHAHREQQDSGWLRLGEQENGFKKILTVALDESGRPVPGSAASSGSRQAPCSTSGRRQTWRRSLPSAVSRRAGAWSPIPRCREACGATDRTSWSTSSPAPSRRRA